MADGRSYVVRPDNTQASRAPLVTDDGAAGWEPGSRWIWQGRLWLCVNANSGAAQWLELGLAGGQGPAGPAGPQGIQGPAGGVGLTGAQGPVGPSGGVGPQGPQGIPGTTTWAGLTGVPATFPPSPHTHPTSEVTGLDAALAGKQSVLGFTPEDSAKKGQASGYAPLDAALKVPAANAPAKAVYTTGGAQALTPSDLGAQAALGFTPQDAASKGLASGYASLDAGAKVPIAQLPTGQTAVTVPLGNDARFSDARAPTAHHATHEPGGTDPLTVDAAPATGSLRTLGSGAQQACPGNDARLANARTPTVHAASHAPGGSDALVVDAAAATGSLRTLGAGAVQACAGNDARLSDARVPLAHTHPESDVTGLVADLAARALAVNAQDAVLLPVGVFLANLTTLTALTSGLTYFQYVGRSAAALSTLDVVYRIGTAAVGAVTWAELAVFQGAPVAAGSPGLTRLGFTSIAAVVTSAGLKKTTVALAGGAAGQDLWIAYGGVAATTQFQFRGGLADDLQIGVFCTASVRPSLATAPQAVTLAGGAVVPGYFAVRI